jgi:hypothetical protein
MSYPITLHPATIARRTHIEELRRELADAFDRHIALTFELLPQLRARYEELFGELEREVQSRTLERSRRRRMVELFALKLDRGEKLDARMVELVMKAVGAEFGRIEARAERRAGEMQRRQGRRPASADAEESPRARADEGRRLYRQLARRLHPDARGGEDELARRYWHLAQEGYLRGDLQLLRALVHLVSEVDVVYHTGIDALAAEEKRLAAAITAERARIDAITIAEPYTIRDMLEDPEWAAARRRSFEEELEGIDREIEKCNGFLDPILATAKDASPPAVARDVWANFVETMYFNNR